MVRLEGVGERCVVSLHKECDCEVRGMGEERRLE